MRTARQAALYGFSGVLLILTIVMITVYITPSMAEEDKVEPSKLLVVWTSADKDVAMNMVYMYTYNAMKNGWWDEVRFLVWGPSSKLLSEDAELQEYIWKMKEVGVELLACKACADTYGVSADLEKLGIRVDYMGMPLTDMVKSGWKTLTF